MERGSERHGVDDQEVIVGEFEQDDLEEVACQVGSDDEDLGRICVGFEIPTTSSLSRNVENVGSCLA
jgi:hypothetical protein